jgi:hypothetical protein
LSWLPFPNTLPKVWLQNTLCNSLIFVILIVIHPLIVLHFLVGFFAVVFQSKQWWQEKKEILNIRKVGVLRKNKYFSKLAK